MFTITQREDGEIVLTGRFDASRVADADAVLDRVTSTCRVNMKELDYISSLGLGILLKTQKRLKTSGNELILTHMNKLIRDVFRIARFDTIFKIEEA
jgi:anti-sigma B factor antagonist